MKTIEGGLCHGDGRYALVVARFNGFVVESLLAAAVDTLKRHGVDEQRMEVVRVPGAWEMPVVVQRLAARGDIDAVIALGCVIRGGTAHFDYVAGECVKGLSSVSLATGKPVALGVLTVDNIEQAIERAGTKAGNKGADAALAALELVDVLRQIPA